MKINGNLPAVKHVMDGYSTFLYGGLDRSVYVYDITSCKNVFGAGFHKAIYSYTVVCGIYDCIIQTYVYIGLVADGYHYFFYRYPMLAIAPDKSDNFPPGRAYDICNFGVGADKYTL